MREEYLSSEESRRNASSTSKTSLLALNWRWTRSIASGLLEPLLQRQSKSVWSVPSDFPGVHYIETPNGRGRSTP